LGASYRIVSKSRAIIPAGLRDFELQTEQGAPIYNSLEEDVGGGAHSWLVVLLGRVRRLVYVPCVFEGLVNLWDKEIGHGKTAIL